VEDRFKRVAALSVGCSEGEKRKHREEKERGNGQKLLAPILASLEREGLIQWTGRDRGGRKVWRATSAGSDKPDKTHVRTSLSLHGGGRNGLVEPWSVPGSNR
jgi:hypothetical protein